MDMSQEGGEHQENEQKTDKKHKKFDYKHSKIFDKYDEEGEVASLKDDWPFCNIYHNEKDRIVYEDDKVFVIFDRSPGWDTHYLINPIRHIKSVGYLRPSDKALAEHILKIAKQLIDEKDLPKKTMVKFGFHKDRWISIPHLHCHVLAGKYTGFKNRFKYIWPFFKPLNSVINKL